MNPLPPDSGQSAGDGQRALETLISGLEAKRNGGSWLARCPAHNDRTPSLAISQGDGGKILVRCHAGCSQGNVINALRERGLWPEPATRNGRTRSPHRYPTFEAAVATLETRLGGTLVGSWTYHRADGSEALRVIRINQPSGGKEYRPLHQTPEGWVVATPPGPLPLYGLPNLADAKRVYVVEGEKCVQAAELIGLTATTSAHGAKAAARTDWGPLAGKEVIILPDNDEAGRGYAREVAQILRKLDPPATVKIVEISELPEGDDLADYLDLRDSTDGEDIAQYLEYLADHAPAYVPPENSFRAPIESELARIEFPLPIPASALGQDIELEWVWEGYIARGFITLLTGLWKAGKTTLLAHLIRAMADGRELAAPVTAGRVLVVAEEGRLLWSRRCEELAIGDYAEFDVQPFLGRPMLGQWESYVCHLAELVKSRDYKLVIFDTLASFSPVRDENDAASMMATVAPLHRITQAGAGVLLVHHPRKGDAREGQASRGSGALTGFVDIITELRRFDAERRNDARRVLTSYSRFSETPPELVIELTDSGYRCCGTKADAGQHERMEVIAEIIRSAPDAPRIEGILGGWPDDEIPRPGKRTLERDLRTGVDAGQWVVTGEGKKGDPHRYHATEDSFRASSLSIGARNEFGADSADDQAGAES